MFDEDDFDGFEELDDGMFETLEDRLGHLMDSPTDEPIMNEDDSVE